MEIQSGGSRGNFHPPSLSGKNACIRRKGEFHLSAQVESDRRPRKGGTGRPKQRRNLNGADGAFDRWLREYDGLINFDMAHDGESIQGRVLQVDRYFIEIEYEWGTKPTRVTQWIAKGMIARATPAKGN